LTAEKPLSGAVSKFSLQILLRFSRAFLQTGMGIESTKKIFSPLLSLLATV